MTATDSLVPHSPGHGSEGRRSALQVALVVLLLATAFVGARLAAHDGDPGAFVNAGSTLTNPGPETHIDVRSDDLGYDGQFFHRLARAPFDRSIRHAGTRYDRPAYRQARIGYPLVVWAISAGGRPAVVPWVLIGVNLAALAGAAYLAARLAQAAGRPAWWAILVAAWPGLMVALSYDLSEVLAATLLLGALLALRRRQWVPAAALLVAGGLTRETTLVLAVAIVGAAIVRRFRPPTGPLRRLMGDSPAAPVPVLVGLIPVAVVAAWRLLLTAWWSDVPSTGPSVPSFITVPGVSLVAQLAQFVTSANVVDWYLLLQLLLVIGVVGALVWRLREPGAGETHERLALIGALAILAMAPVWDRSVVFLRWPDEVVVLGFAVLISSRRPVSIRPLAKATVVLAATTALVWVTL